MSLIGKVCNSAVQESHETHLSTQHTILYCTKWNELCMHVHASCYNIFNCRFIYESYKQI